LERIPIDKALGTVVAERAVDLVFLIFFIGIAFLVELGRLLAFIDTLNVDLSNSVGLLLKVGLIMLFSIGIVYLIFRVLLAIKKTRFLKVLVKVKKVFGGIKEGLLIVFRLEKNRLFVVYSILIWVFYFLMTYSMLLAFPETNEFGLSASLALFALAGIAMAIPLPGGTGSYHIIVPAGLVFLYGIAEDKATAFTFIFHGWQTLIFIVVGLFAIILSQIKPGSVSKK